MAKLNIKKGDPVVVIAGDNDYKGKSGKVLSVDPESNRITVEGVKTVVKHVKARKAQERGGRIDQPASIDRSNVMIVCSECGQPTRIGMKVVEENGKPKKIRVCKKCGASLEVAAIKSKSAVKKATKKKKAESKEKADAPIDEKVEKSAVKTTVRKATTKPAETTEAPVATDAQE